MNKKFLRFRYAAIKRYGDKHWTAHDGAIEFNPNYVVNCGECEKGNFGDDHDYPFIVELSNGTKFLCFMHEYGQAASDDILSEQGETANCYVSDASYSEVKNNIYKLNNTY